MKSTNTTLINFMENATQFVRMDLYQFTLNGGSTVLSYSGGNLPITYNGFYYNLGPPIQDSGVQATRGVSSTSVDITILGGDGRFTVDGLDILDFLENFGLDGATARIDRIYADTWSDMFSVGPTGGYQRFGGFCGEIKELGQTQAVVTLNSWIDLLSTPYPADVYSTSCLNTFGSSDCGVNVPALTVSATAGNGSYTATQLDFGSSLTQATGYFNLGVCTFTSGVNSGISRSVKAYSNSYGEVTVTAPFPSPPAFGDQFTISPGCSLSIAACTGWDGVSPAPANPWYKRLRSTPFVPPPTTGLPS